MMFLETLLKFLHRLFFEVSFDPVISHLVHMIDPVFQPAENKQHDQNQHTAEHRYPFVTCADTHAECGRHPDQGSGRDTVYSKISFEYYTGANEPDACSDIRCYPVGITSS